MTIRVFNDANVGRQAQREAQNVAARIFRKAGLEIRWVDAVPIRQNTPETAVDRRLFDPTELQLRILSPPVADSLDLPQNVMGWAPGAGRDRQHVYVFYDRVKELAFRQLEQHCNQTIGRPATLGQILGAMMAHELGHVLLDLPSHSPTGIMRGHWDQKDLQDVAYEDLLFTPQQGEVMRTEMVRRTRTRRALELATLELPVSGP